MFTLWQWSGTELTGSLRSICENPWSVWTVISPLPPPPFFLLFPSVGPLLRSCAMKHNSTSQGAGYRHSPCQAPQECSLEEEKWAGGRQHLCPGLPCFLTCKWRGQTSDVRDFMLPEATALHAHGPCAGLGGWGAQRTNLRFLASLASPLG